MNAEEGVAVGPKWQRGRMVQVVLVRALVFF